MNLDEIRSTVRANMVGSSLHGKNIEFESQSHQRGKVLATAITELSKLPGNGFKRLKKGGTYKDFDVVFYSSSDARNFYDKVQSLAKGSQQPTEVRFSRGQTTAVSHNGNDTTGGKKWYELVGGFGNWVNGVVGNVSGIINNKYDSAEAAAQAQAQAAQAAAEAEAAKSRNTMIAIGAGVLVLALVLILALRKK